MVIAYDLKSFSFTKKLTTNVLKNNMLINQTEEVKFLNKDYVKVIMSRMMLINFILSRKYSVFVFDTDIVLFKNPLPYLLHYSQYDIIAQKELPHRNIICCGFMYML